MFVIDYFSQSPIKNLGLYGSVVDNSYHYDNALNPAWRDAVVHLIAKESWSDGISTEEKQTAVDDMTYEKGYALRQLAPHSGAYFNDVCSPSILLAILIFPNKRE